MDKRVLTAAAIMVGGLAIAGGYYYQTRKLVGKQADGSYIVSTNQTLTPAGIAVTLQGQRPKDLAVSPTGRFVAILAHRKIIIVDRDGKMLSELAAVSGPVGIAWSPGEEQLFASTNGGKVLNANWNGAKLTKMREFTVRTSLEGPLKTKLDPHLAGMAISLKAEQLYVAMTTANAVAVIDVTTGETIKVIDTGVAPYHVALSGNGKTLAVANRGGRQVKPPSAQIEPGTGKPFEGIGVPTANSAGTPVQIDPTTDAAWRGTVSLIDTETFDAREISVGRQPSGMAFSPSGESLYVTESDSDSISFVDVKAGQVLGNLSVRPPQDPQFGQIPTDVEASQDGQRLYVTLGGINAVAVVELKGQPKVAGYVPTGWFPIALETAGDRVFVASAKGIGSRPSSKTTGFGVHDNVGLFQSIPLNDFKGLRKSSQLVARNNLWNELPKSRAGRQPVPVPQRLGEPSVFKHVVYIIKENLTYDSTLGDMKEGNGDPSLCTFGEQVSPNHHALAREFVLLDNFYTSGTNSADGHQWTSSSIANGYTEQNYASNVRSYPYDGGDALAYSPEGFLWTAAHKAGKSVRVFGEFVNKPKVINPATKKAPTWKEAWEDYKSGKNSMIIEAHTDNAALRPHLHPNFIGFPSIISDQWRTDQFLAEFKQWERAGKMPDLTIMLLPNDHTAGTRAGMPTPRAAVADNDLALGRMVEAISKSQFWKDTLILVIEDDSQLGVDHVDGHRSVAFCISPYTQRGKVVSEMYNHTSFVRTLGLILGIPPMNRFDRTGMPLTACFTRKADLAPYIAKKNIVPLDEMNPDPKDLTGIQRELAIASGKLDLSDIDRAHAKTVTMAVWYSVFPKRPFPDELYHPPDDQDEDDE